MHGSTSLWKMRLLMIPRQLSMKALLMIITLAMVTALQAQGRSTGMQEEILRLEKEFGKAIVKNDVEGHTNEVSADCCPSGQEVDAQSDRD
jgi:hypothetical protein